MRQVRQLPQVLPLQASKKFRREIVLCKKNLVAVKVISKEKKAKRSSPMFLLEKKLSGLFDQDFFGKPLFGT